MSPKTLAHKLLQFRASTSLMVPGALAAEIGYPAVQDALQRGWIQPDHESGFLTLSPEAGKLQEMQRLTDCVCDKCGKDECVCDVPEKKQESYDRRSLVVGHSRRMTEAYGVGLGVSTSGAPGSGQPARPATPEPQMAPSANRPGDEYMVGEDVVIADEGKSYQAKVASKNSDGTYKLTFGPNRPMRQDRAFRREEMQRVDPRGTTMVPVARS